MITGGATVPPAVIVATTTTARPVVSSTTTRASTAPAVTRPKGVDAKQLQQFILAMEHTAAQRKDTAHDVAQAAQSAARATAEDMAIALSRAAMSEQQHKQQAAQKQMEVIKVRKAAAAIVMAKVAIEIMVARKKQMQREHADKNAAASAVAAKAMAEERKIRLQLQSLEHASEKDAALRKKRAAESASKAKEKKAKYDATPEGMQHEIRANKRAADLSELALLKKRVTQEAKLLAANHAPSGHPGVQLDTEQQMEAGFFGKSMKPGSPVRHVPTKASAAVTPSPTPPPTPYIPSLMDILGATKANPARSGKATKVRATTAVPAAAAAVRMRAPTYAPTSAPALKTQVPTAIPTAAPTGSPTTAPTAAPTKAPVPAPTPVPTPAPTPEPTIAAFTAAGGVRHFAFPSVETAAFKAAGAQANAQAKAEDNFVAHAERKWHLDVPTPAPPTPPPTPAPSVRMATTAPTSSLAALLPPTPQPTTAAAVAHGCPQGRFALMIRDPKGKQPAQQFCMSCQPGQFKARKGTDKCKGCPPGTQSTSGKVACARLQHRAKVATCPVGKFSTLDEHNKTFCYDCPRGKFSAKASKEQCTRCAQGKFQGLPGTRGCKLCPEGKFQLHKGQHHCAKLLGFLQGREEHNHALVGVARDRELLRGVVAVAKGLARRVQQAESLLAATKARVFKEYEVRVELVGTKGLQPPNITQFAMEQGRLDGFLKAARSVFVTTQRAVSALHNSKSTDRFSVDTSRDVLSSTAHQSLSHVTVALNMFDEVVASHPELKQFQQMFLRMQALLNSVRDDSAEGQPVGQPMQSANEALRRDLNETMSAGKVVGGMPLKDVMHALQLAEKGMGRVIRVCAGEDGRLTAEIKDENAEYAKVKKTVLMNMLHIANVEHVDVANMDPAKYGLKRNAKLDALSLQRLRTRAVAKKASAVATKLELLTHAAKRIQASRRLVEGGTASIPIDGGGLGGMDGMGGMGGAAALGGFASLPNYGARNVPVEFGGTMGQSAPSPFASPVDALAHIEKSFSRDAQAVKMKEEVNAKFIAMVQEEMAAARHKQQQLDWEEEKAKHELTEKSYHGHYSTGANAVAHLDHVKRLLQRRFAPYLKLGKQLEADAKTVAVVVKDTLKAFHLYAKGYTPRVADAMPVFESVVHELKGVVAYHSILAKQYARVKQAVTEVRDQLADMTTSDPGIALNKAMISPEFGITLKHYNAERAALAVHKPFMRKVVATCSQSAILTLGAHYDKQGLLGSGQKARRHGKRRRMQEQETLSPQAAAGALYFSSGAMLGIATGVAAIAIMCRLGVL
jgi:hypothetical protein